MAIRISFGDRNRGKFTSSTCLKSPNIDRIKEEIYGTLFNHPLNTGILTAEAEVQIEINVTIGGQDYSALVPWASIDYISFLDDRLKPIKVEFHLVRFWGDLGAYGLGVPDAQVILEAPVNWDVLRSIFYHEFSHLLDALNPSFHFDKGAYLSVTLESRLRFALLDLWNAYIDRRLSAALRSQYMIEPTRPSLCVKPKTKVQLIWDSDNDYDFPTLLKMAKESLT